ncbi:protein mono-ADP-ribosyltransferase TIPARP-like [Heteronotia binoei]|uniref:protein mono-ADP-ribosyltransferase TIPARP-like n=1 Tax=Heteronotia binoei TaxID=13085 RepID=UPI00292E9D06|nr:protein mono-ADP-ribosyltransferase TIPARP-like [Heteronotia binoei]
MAEKPKRSETEVGHSNSPDVSLGITVLEPSSINVPQYHVHQKDGVQICDNFLLGGCLLQEQCPHHHTPFPYHWQWRRKKDCVWLSFSFSAQHHLERLYCDPNFSQAELVDRWGFVRVLNLDTMTFRDIMLYDKIRRLSNSSDPACNPHFPAEWKVYWKELGSWREYEEPVAQELVAAFERGLWNHAFYLDGHLYNVDLKNHTQCNVRTKFSRPVIHRPVLRSCANIAPYLRSVASALCTAAVPGEDPLDLYCGSYPAEWVPQPCGDLPFTMVEVTLPELAYQKVSKLFHDSLPEGKALVLSIYRIRNNHLWQAYVRQKVLMCQNRCPEDQHSLEKHLFHGTGAAQIRSICAMNFDSRLAGLNGSAYGKGIYFAKNAAYSHTYARATQDNVHCMFLAKVLTGYTANGNSKLKRPPVCYDSCTDCTKDPRIFVIFKNCQCYPYFLICYKEVAKPVAVEQ